MPIKPSLRHLYPSNWSELSAIVRFGRAGGRCQRCGRPHMAPVSCLPDGRWFDEGAGIWRDERNHRARPPDLFDEGRIRSSLTVLAAAHLNHDPSDNRFCNLRALCQRCHLAHDRRHHQDQRWKTLRAGWASGDLFLGPYAAPSNWIEAARS